MTWQAASGAPVELSHGHAGAAGLPQHGGMAAVTLATGSTSAVCQSPTVIGALAGRVSCRRILARLRSGRLSVTRAQIRCFGARDLSGLAWKQPPPANW